MLKATLLTCGLLLAAAAPAHAQMRGNSGKFLESADANKDGAVSREEFLSHRSKTFAKIDRNSDGYVDQDDMPKRRRALSGGGGERIAELREQFDKDSDGRISQEEFINGPTLVFDHADANQDNVLDANELAAVKEAAKQRKEAASSR